MEKLEILSQRGNIERAFKSLIKSGRPDIKDEDNNNLVPELYVDLFEGNYILNQVLDDNHVILKGRKGTGKSTVFVQAEQIMKNQKSKISVYINLQSCYEEIRTSDMETQDMYNKFNMYRNFFFEVLSTIKKRIVSLIPDKDIDELFEEIKNGEYIDADFQRRMQVTNCERYSNDAQLQISDAKYRIVPESSIQLQQKKSIKNEETHIQNEMRIFSINKILTKIKKILERHRISKVYLLLDDFSELTEETQKLIIDSLISPIITSYNDMFVVKLAAYPYRIYLGNIDSSKIVPFSLDFYDVYEKTANNYAEVELLAIDYVKRTLARRIDVYTHGQVRLEELFDTSKTEIEMYYKTLFYASSGIPRCLGYILTYCFLSSINKGNCITIQNINSAAKKYYNDNILPDFYNDNRYKQSFYDDEKILNQLTQRTLMDDLITTAKMFKRKQIEQYNSGQGIKQIYIETLRKYKKGIVDWLPSSHFYVDKNIENMLHTLELYFIVSKFNEGSTRQPGKKVSYFGLNYGLCLENSIDYGKPELRRAYDYWRQDEFNYTDIIPAILKSIEVPICNNCGYEYNDKNEYNIVNKFGYCLQCKSANSIKTVNKFREVLEEKIKKWKTNSLPDLYIDILRVLYNNLSEELTAFEIGSEIDKHHLAITKSMDKLSSLGYVSYERRDKRYYKIEKSAIDKFFSED